MVFQIPIVELPAPEGLGQRMLYIWSKWWYWSTYILHGSMAFMIFIWALYQSSSWLSYFIYFIEALAPSLIGIAVYRSYWYCQRSSHQINTQSFTGVILVEILPLFETERLPTSRLSIPDRFRPLPRGHPQWTLPLEISRYFYWHTATFEFVNTYDHLSRLCNHLWLHSPSDTTWVWTQVARIWSA